MEDPPSDDPRAPLSGLMAHVQTTAAALDGDRSVAVASSGRSQTSSSAADFSIATTAVPSAGIPHCNNAPSDAPVEIASHILSTNTPAFVAVALAAGLVFLCLAVAFFVELADLDWGSWEGSLPESSSLGGDCTPLRGAFHMIQASAGIQELTAGKTLSALRIGDIFLPPSTPGGAAPCGPPKWPILSPPPTPQSEAASGKDVQAVTGRQILGKVN